MTRSMLALAAAAVIALTPGPVDAQKGNGGSKVSPGPKTIETTTIVSASPKTKTHGKAAATTVTAAKTTLTLSPVQQTLQRNTNLAIKVQGRLPSGTHVITAAEGFRNLDQFVAAVNVSNNLGIPFAGLKTRMVDDGFSLGQAIQAERRDVDVSTAVRRAERDAEIIIADSDAAAKTKTKAPKAPKPAKRDGQR